MQVRGISWERDSLRHLARRHVTEQRVPISSPTFAQIIQRARLHDEQALVTLYHHALPIIYRYVLARLGQADVTEDVVAEVFLTMIEAISDLRTEEEAGFYAWLLQIAQGKVSRALRHLVRSNQRQVLLPDSNRPAGSSAVEPVATDLESNPVAWQEWQETLEEVRQALGSLTEDQQIVVVGHFLAGQTMEEVAQALGKRAGAVRALQFRALQSLARRLGLVRYGRRREKGGPA